MPLGNPRKFRIHELVAACPPMASRSTIRVRSPSDAAFTAAARPEGPPPTMVTSKRWSRAVSTSNASANRGVRRIRHRRPVEDLTTGRSVARHPQGPELRASSAVATSTKSCSSPLRVRMSRSSCDRGVPRSPGRAPT
jgi:hypothetical protein